MDKKTGSPKQKNKYAVLLSEETGSTYQEAFQEMKDIKDLTGILFSEYYKNGLHDLSKSFRIRKARQIVSTRKKRKERLDAICEETGLEATEIRERVRELNQSTEGYTVNIASFFKHELYHKEGEELARVIGILKQRQPLLAPFAQAHREAVAGTFSWDELEKMFEEIKALTEQIMTGHIIEDVRSKALERYPESELDDETILKMAIECESLYQTDHYSRNEYFEYDMYHLSFPEMMAFTSSFRRGKAYQEINSEEIRILFNDKYECYCKYKKAYGRSIVQVRDERDYPAFHKFCRKHPVFAKKPSFNLKGEGAGKVSKADYPDDKTMMLTLLKENGEFVAEELVIADKEYGKITPGTINTVRLTAFNTGSNRIELDPESKTVKTGQVLDAGDGIYFLSPFFKTGRSGAFADNVAAGGLNCPVDLRDGHISGDACDSHGVRFTHHPDTGIAYEGWQLPKWQEAIALAKKSLLEMPQAGVIGWDLTFNKKKKWIIIEGNANSALVGQAASKCGVYKEFLQLVEAVRKRQEKP